MYRKILYKIRTGFRFLNRKKLFFELRKTERPTLIIAGYTRSGTTYLAYLLSGILKSRCIHEPLHPEFSPPVSFFHEREAKSVIQDSAKHLAALQAVFRAEYRGVRRDIGPRAIYSGRRIIKLVRANFYLDLIAELLPDVPILFLIRNPLACIASRSNKEWLVPDHSNCIQDILPLLNEAQKDLVNKEEDHHKKLAISWCLDNYMALTNLKNEKFKFVYYENIVGSLSEIESILDFIDTSIAEKRIRKEIELYRLTAPKKTIFTRADFETRLGKKETQDILEVVDTFGFGAIYDFDTGRPGVLPG
jgi:hypothetical protein